MTFDFPQLIAHAAKTRPLAAGTHHRLGHGLQQARRRARASRWPKAAPATAASSRCARSRRLLHGTAEDAVPVLRRHGPHRDEGPGRPLDLRRDRADACNAAEAEQDGEHGLCGYRLSGPMAMSGRSSSRRSGSATGSRRARRTCATRAAFRATAMIVACGDQLERRARRRDPGAAAPHEPAAAGQSRRLRACAAVHLVGEERVSDGPARSFQPHGRQQPLVQRPPLSRRAGAESPASSKRSASASSRRSRRRSIISWRSTCSISTCWRRAASAPAFSTISRRSTTPESSPRRRRPSTPG